MKGLAVMALLVLCGAAGASEVYKWTDENGKVHYGDKLAAPEASDRMDVNGESPRERRQRRFQAWLAEQDEERKQHAEKMAAQQRERAAREQAEAARPERPAPAPRSSTPRYSRPPFPGLPDFDPNKKSVPVPASRVGPTCKGLADRIGKVKQGEVWTDLARQFDRECPGIAYECSVYKRRQKPDKCQWVKRDGGTMRMTNVYE